MFDPESIASFPIHPGVYIMKNAAGDVIYVGKAANLRSRVRNYFSKTGDNRLSVPFLVRQVETIDIIVTGSEKEAFLLENTLIKKYRPRYNIRLRDDKTYVSLRMKMNHDYPRLEIVRVRRGQLGSAGSTVPGTGEALQPDEEPGTPKRRRRDLDLYFGPYTSSGAVRETLRFLLKIFPVRTCRDSVFRNRTRPCILYDVGKCCAPCTEPVSKEEYAGLVQRVATFLRGRDDEVRQALEQRMEELSEVMEFEKAGLIRDRLRALDRTLESQNTETHEGTSRDVIAVESAQGRSLVTLQQFRSGVLIHSTDFYTRNYEQEDPEVLYSFISQHYDDLSGQIPPEILVSVEPADAPLLEEWLRDRRGAGVRLHVPMRGKLNALMHSARQNARAALNRRLSGERNEEETLNELVRRLGLEKVPRVIECVDISNTMGFLAVGSLVRFEDGHPDKSGYRLFRVRTVEGSNDFAMMHEVLSRRFRPDNEKGRDFPDLLIVDGGKGQLGVAQEVFRELNIQGVELAGMAKSRLKVRPVTTLRPNRRDMARAVVGISPPPNPESPKESGDSLNTFFPDAPGYIGEDEVPAEPVTVSPVQRFRTVNVRSGETPASEEKIRFRTEERLFLPGRKNPVTFPPNSPALFLLERIRDETHRTAITYHRKLRQKTNRRSMLDEVPGVGPKRKKILLKHYGSLAGLRAASVEDIAGVEGITKAAAENVWQFMHSAPETLTPVGTRLEEEWPESEEDEPENAATPEGLLDPGDFRREK